MGKPPSSNRRCWALCCGADARNSPHLAFFRFPADEKQCIQWVKLSGNSTLFLNTHAFLKSNRALCSKHFCGNNYRIYGEPASFLNKNVLPSIFTEPPIPDSCLPSSLLKAGPQSSVTPPASLNVEKENIPPPVLIDCNTVVPNASVLSGNGNTSSSELSSQIIFSGDSSHVSPTPAPVPNATLKRKVLSVVSTCDASLNKRRRLDFSSDSGVSSLPSLCDSLATSTPALPPVCESALATSTPALPSVSDTPVPCTRFKRTSNLSAYGLHKCDITPKKQVIIENANLLRGQVRSLRRSLQAARDNEKVLKKFANQPLVSHLSRIMKTREGAILIEAQVANHGKKPQGFRWTLEQKTLGLALYKNSRKNYNFLRKILILPGRTCILAVMAWVKFETGLNKHSFDH